MIGVFGGTFDPIHLGHLRTALELYETLRLKEVRLLPCAIPPHREQPVASAEQRLAMVRLAVKGQPGLLVDDRELYREGPSYTVYTLRSLREEFPHQPLCLILGADAFLGLDTWHCWQDIPELAHLVVVHRPGWELPHSKNQSSAVSENLTTLLTERRVQDASQLARQSAGNILFCTVTQMDISSSGVRYLVSSGRSPRYLLPDDVLDYITKEAIYSK
jgi:nicotinate-nucleotide adenylyltransferase